MKLPNVHRVPVKGRVYKYHRHTRVELPNDVPESHPKFIAAWTAEESKKPVKAPKAAHGTIAYGCEAYFASGVFRELSDSYRPVIRRHVEKIKAQYGTGQIRGLQSYHINKDLDPLSPAVARSRLKAWRKLTDFWQREGLIESNIGKGAVGKKMPATEGHKEWTPDDLKTYRDHWGPETPQRHACELLQWTGARCVDAVRLGPGMIKKSGLLEFRQQKTKEMAYVPWTCDALGMESERELLLSYPKNHMVFLTTKFGKPRSHKAFSAWFSDSCNKAKLSELSAHGLRKYRMNQLSERGASVLQMQAWVGHVTLQEIEEYTRKAQRRAAFSGTEQVQNM